jgi:hypothetical protein
MAVELSYAVPGRRRRNHATALGSICCALLPVCAMALHPAGLLTGLILMPIGLLSGLLAVFDERSIVLGTIGSALNGIGIAFFGWLFFIEGLC